jgi:WD40 repeat protein
MIIVRSLNVIFRSAKNVGVQPLGAIGGRFASEGRLKPAHQNKFTASPPKSRGPRYFAEQNTTLMFRTILSWIVCFLSITLGPPATAEPPMPRLTISGGGGYVIFSPDGTRLAGQVPGKIWRATDVKVWEIPTGKVLAVLKGHSGGIWQLAFNPNGQRLISNDNYETKVWDLENKKEFRSLKMPNFTRTITFLGDGKQIATGHEDGRVILWDIETARPVRTLRGHTDWVTDLVLSNDGKLLGTASIDMTARIWDVAEGKVVQTLSGHTWYLNRLAFGPQAKRLATSSDDKTAKIWDVATGKALFTLRGHNEWVVGVAFSPDGKWVATGGGDHTVRVWDARTGEEVVTIHEHADHVGCVKFSPDGRTLATASLDKTIKLWDVDSLVSGE